LFKLAVDAVGYGDFTRAKRGTGTDAANRFLDHGNYLAYGLGATATWVLGLPHGLAVLHGKTRRGGLVFDAADLVKDAAILPQAFLSAMRGDDEQAFRRNCIEALTRSESLDFIIDSLKAIADRHGAAGAASQAARRMNVLFVSQCSKRADRNAPHPRPVCRAPRRAHLANAHHPGRAGHRAQTAAPERTQEHRRGLPLDTRARPQRAAVGGGRWPPVQRQGAVPTNTTASNVLRAETKEHWHHLPLMTALAALAALLHDLGKATQAFQERLRNPGLRERNHYRHEWVSVRLFQAFVGRWRCGWLQRLAACAERNRCRRLKRCGWITRAAACCAMGWTSPGQRTHRLCCRRWPRPWPGWCSHTTACPVACRDKGSGDEDIDEGRPTGALGAPSSSMPDLEAVLARVSADWNEPREAVARPPCSHWHFPHGLPVVTTLAQAGRPLRPQAAGAGAPGERRHCTTRLPCMSRACA
jgi:hypothetical protein